MSRKRKAIDDENPEWTKADFARAKKPEELLPPEVLRNFKHHRGPQKTPTKVPVSIRLSPAVVEHFKATGSGWQARIDEALLRIAKRGSSKNKTSGRRKGKAA